MQCDEGLVGQLLRLRPEPVAGLVFFALVFFVVVLLVAVRLVAALLAVLPAVRCLVRSRTWIIEASLRVSR